MRIYALILILLVLLSSLPAAAQASNPEVEDCGFPAQGEIIQSVTYTLKADCLITETLSIKGNNITVTINGEGHTILYSKKEEAQTSLPLLRSTTNPCSANTINLNQVTIDAGSVERTNVLSVCGSLTANKVTFRRAYGGVFLLVLENAQAALTDVLFEDNESWEYGNYRTQNSSAMLILGSATFHNVVLRGNRYSAAAVRLRTPASEDADPATLTATGCLWLAGNIPLAIDDEFGSEWTDEDTVPCAAGSTIGNGAKVRAEPQPASCGLPDSGNLFRSRVYSLTKDCDLRGSLYISEGLQVGIKGNGHTIRTDADARIELAHKSTLTMENVYLDGVRIYNFGDMTLSKVGLINMPNLTIFDMGRLSVSNMLANNNSDPVVFTYWGYRKGMSTIEDSAIRNTDARARGRGEAFSRAALYARGGDHPARQTPTGVNITLKGCITFENNLPQDKLAFGDGTIMDESAGPCAMPVGPDPKRPDPTSEPDDEEPDPPTPTPRPSPSPTPSPTPTALPYVCKPTERILVQTGNDDLQCEPVDIITLDKHPDLQGVRFAVRLWRVIPPMRPPGNSWRQLVSIVNPISDDNRLV